jgi:hypothetical protein
MLLACIRGACGIVDVGAYGETVRVSEAFECFSNHKGSDSVSVVTGMSRNSIQASYFDRPLSS